MKWHVFEDKSVGMILTPEEYRTLAALTKLDVSMPKWLKESMKWEEDSLDRLSKLLYWINQIKREFYK